MKYKLVEADYIDEIGYSHVTIANHKGRYSADAQLNMEDDKYASSFFGCQLAESRAYIKLLKSELKEKRIQLKTMNDVYDILATNKDFDYKNYSSRKLRKLIYLKRKEIEKIKEEIALIETYISTSPEKRIEQVDNYKKRKDTEKNKNLKDKTE